MSRQLLYCVLALAACSGEPSECCKHAAADAATAAGSSDDADARAAVHIPDVVLVDQRGRRVRLHDLVGGKRVIIDFVFTTCTSVCPTLQTVMQGVQQRLGDRLGTDTVLLSISVDPANDTPERLQAFAADYGARAGWHFLTGAPADVIDVLRAFGVYTSRKEEHSAMFVLGDERRGRWMYQSGFADPAAIVARLEAL
jgi:protein SCO1/2